jgi:hypothetical protein
MKIADSEWMAYFDLKEEDITHQYFQNEGHMVDAMVADRMGRVVLLLPQDDYQKFLSVVRKRFGNIYASSVNGALVEAVQEWMSKE